MEGRDDPKDDGTGASAPTGGYGTAGGSAGAGGNDPGPGGAEAGGGPGRYGTGDYGSGGYGSDGYGSGSYGSSGHGSSGYGSGGYGAGGAGPRLFDDLARLVTDAAGAAQGVRREVETAMRAQMEGVLSRMDVVRRDEFEAVREMAARARAECDALRAEIEALRAERAGVGRAGGDAPDRGSSGTG